MKNRILSIMAAAVVLLGASASIAADTYTIDPVHSSVVFKIRHLVSKTSGRFGDFGGKIQLDKSNLEASSVNFEIKAASIDTDNENRDAHLKSEDFFAVEAYPEITFNSTKIEKTGDNTYDVTGNFTMRGTTKTITVPVEVLGIAPTPDGGSIAGFETAFELNRKEYGIEWNKALDIGGLLLGDEVEVNITVEAGAKGE